MKLKDMNREMLRYHADVVKKHTVRSVRAVHKHALSTRKKIVISTVGVLVIGVVVAQFLYPTDRTAWFSKVDGIEVGGMEKGAAAVKLDDAYAQAVVPIYYKDDTKHPKASPTLGDIGLTVSNSERVAAIDYPWYWRLVPSSALWYYGLQDSGKPVVARDDAKIDTYMAETFGASCTLAPSNATIALSGEKLEVIQSTKGGTCSYSELRGMLAAVKGELTQDKIVVSGTTIEPAVNDENAAKVLKAVTEKIDDGVVLVVNGKDEVIAKSDIYKWLVFAASGDTLTYSLSADALPWVTEKYGKSVALPAGTSYVTTHDFVETARTDGAAGRALDAGATARDITQFIEGKVAKPSAKTIAVAPTVQYTRSYSATDTGMAALFQQYAETHPGTYGISMVELSGERRHASYNGAKQFTTASTYKLFVAYSSLLRIESGAWNWSDDISGGRNLAKCFDDMIVKSDNACAEALLKKVGFSAITNEAKAIGATKTSFLGSDGVKSTAEDEALLLSLLHSGQILNQQSSRDTFINALKRNVYRKGIPAGMPGSTVANKVGFLDGLLHDAGIVYSPSGVYVLVILTDGSSWANIAELTRELEKLRAG